MQLDDAVEDRHGYVYERAALLDALSRAPRGYVVSPFVGARFFLLLSVVVACVALPRRRLVLFCLTLRVWLTLSLSPPTKHPTHKQKQKTKNKHNKLKAPTTR